MTFSVKARIPWRLCLLFDLPLNEELSRVDITRLVNNFIRTYGLRDSMQPRKIHPNNKLRFCLRVAETDELTYFNLQRYIGFLYKNFDAEENELLFLLYCCEKCALFGFYF